eukprot:403355515
MPQSLQNQQQQQYYNQHTQQQYPNLPFYPGNPPSAIAFYQNQALQSQQPHTQIQPEDTYYNVQGAGPQYESSASTTNQLNNLNYGSNKQHNTSQGSTGTGGNITDKEVVAFRFQDKDYNIFGDALLNDYDANQIYSKLLQESRQQNQENLKSSHGSGSGGVSSQKKNSSSWRDDETHLLQWSIFTYALQKNISIEEFTESDWGNVAEFIPTRDKIKCFKRWLFIQKLGGNKSQWTKRQDQALLQIVEHEGAKEWSKIAEALNVIVGSQRNGKQCRERWNNTLNPQINKGKWTVQEDLVLLEKQKLLGNKWAEISNYLNHRTENQIKNRFNCLIRRGQQKSIDSNSSVKQIIDKMICKFQDQIKASHLKKQKLQQQQLNQNERMELHNPQHHHHFQMMKDNEDFLISSVDGGDDDHNSYSGLDEEDDDDELARGGEFLNDDNYLGDFSDQIVHQQVFSDLNIGLSSNYSKVEYQNDIEMRNSPASIEEFKTQQKMSDFQQLHEHSFKVSSEGKQKGPQKLIANQTKNLLMSLVRQDSMPKLKTNRKNSKLNSSGSLEKHKHSRSLSKQGLNTGGSQLKKSNFKKSSKKSTNQANFKDMGQDLEEYNSSQDSHDLDEFLQNGNDGNAPSTIHHVITDNFLNDDDFEVEVKLDHYDQHIQVPKVEYPITGSNQNQFMGIQDQYQINGNNQ